MTQKSLLQSAGDGTAVPAGYVGQIIESTSTLPAVQINLTAHNVMTLTLSKGVYIIFGQIALNTSGAYTWGSSQVVQAGISLVSNTSGEFNTTCRHGSLGRITTPVFGYYTITNDSTVVYLICRNDLTASGSSVYDPLTQFSYFKAIRIA